MRTDRCLTQCVLVQNTFICYECAMCQTSDTIASSVRSLGSSFAVVCLLDGVFWVKLLQWNKITHSMYTARQVNETIIYYQCAIDSMYIYVCVCVCECGLSCVCVVLVESHTDICRAINLINVLCKCNNFGLFISTIAVHSFCLCMYSGFFSSILWLVVRCILEAWHLKGSYLSMQKSDGKNRLNQW